MKNYVDDDHDDEEEEDGGEDGIDDGLMMMVNDDMLNYFKDLYEIFAISLYNTCITGSLSAETN